MVKMNKIFMVIVPELGCREVGCFSDVKTGFDEGMVKVTVLKYLLNKNILNGESCQWGSK